MREKEGISILIACVSDGEREREKDSAEKEKEKGERKMSCVNATCSKESRFYVCIHFYLVCVCVCGRRKIRRGWNEPGLED